ncbi:MAG: hypothetical protein GVY12_02000 [Bacteroidetes bacterium]|jgi:hypothetical protein|nr:hypothetical protein [Bacteroidota bacterium]
MPQTKSPPPKIPLPRSVALPVLIDYDTARTLIRDFDCGHDPRDPAACATCALVVATLAAEQRWPRQTPRAEVQS